MMQSTTRWPRIISGVGALLIIGAAATGCTSGGSESPAPTRETTTTTTTTAAVIVVGQFYDEWSAKFDALAKPQQPACPPERVRSEACADYLAPIVAATLELEKAIRARPDSDRYAGTLAEVAKISQASDRYARCYGGTGTVNQCHAEALAIGFGSTSLLVKLHAEDLKS